MIEVSPSFKKVGRTLQEQTSDMRSWQLSMPSESLEWRSQKAARLWVLKYRISSWFTSLEFSHSVMSNLLWPHGLQHTRLQCQASLCITNSQSMLELMSIESVMPSNHLILCRPLLLLPSIFPSIRVFSNESALHIRWPKYWSFSFSVSPSNEHSGLVSFRID